MSSQPTAIAIGLGSNLGDREAHLVDAVRALEGVVSDIRVGGLYESTAWSLAGAEVAGDSDPEAGQPRYLNSALVGRTHLDPQPLLAVLKFLEQRAGRRRDRRWGPRPLDLDLLLYGDQVDPAPELTLPHPGLRRRPFALAPLADLAPERVVPPGPETVRELLAHLDAGDLDRLDWSRNPTAGDDAVACYSPPASRASPSGDSQ